MPSQAKCQTMMKELRNVSPRALAAFWWRPSGHLCASQEGDEIWNLNPTFTVNAVLFGNICSTSYEVWLWKTSLLWLKAAVHPFRDFSCFVFKEKMCFADISTSATSWSTTLLQYLHFRGTIGLFFSHHIYLTVVLQLSIISLSISLPIIFTINVKK